MPYKKYFKLNNNIFATDADGKQILTPTQRQVLAMMYACDVNGKGWVKVRQSRLAEMCRCSVTTVKRAIDELIAKRYIYNRIRSERHDKWLGTYIYILPKIVTNGYFYVNRKALELLNAVQTRMYLFFCKCARSFKKDFWHSFKDIANELHLQRNSVIRTIKELVELKVINKEVRMTSAGDYADNYYTISEDFESVYTNNDNNYDDEQWEAFVDSLFCDEDKEQKETELPAHDSSNPHTKKLSTQEINCRDLFFKITTYLLICQEVFSKFIRKSIEDLGKFFSSRAGP